MEITAGDEAVAIIIRHLKPLSEEDLAKLVTYGQQSELHIYLQPGGADTVRRLYPYEGEERLSYQLINHDVELRFHPTDFVQINAEINKKLVDLALELLAPSPHEIFLDLFCGIGNFTLPLARYSKWVLGVEGSEEMVRRGYENAKHNGLVNVEFKCQNLHESHYNDTYKGQKYDGILLDPPRTGAFEVVQTIAETEASRIVYISCNPATLARDAGSLVKNGYSMVKVGVLDMFPHTSHVESIALFIKK